MREFATDLFNPPGRIFQKHKNKRSKTKPADSVEAETSLAESQYLLSPGSSDALTAVIHMTVLTWERGRGVLLPVSRVPSLSSLKSVWTCPSQHLSAPQRPSTCLQKSHSTFKSHTSREPWKDAAICSAAVSVNMY